MNPPRNPEECRDAGTVQVKTMFCTADKLDAKVNTFFSETRGYLVSYKVQPYNGELMAQILYEKF